MDRRNELKLEYKNKPKNIGIYQIKNKINGKILLGSTLNLDAAFSRFQFELKYGLGMLRGPELRRDLNECGPENFTFEILDQLKPNEDPLYNYKEDLKTLEELWLEKLQPYDEKGYNQRK